MMESTMRKQTLQINFRTDPETRQRLLDLCLMTQRSQSALLRMLIHELWKKRFQAKEEPSKRVIL